MLFRKAASLYNIMEYGKAEYILRELIKIDPYCEDFILFLRKCLGKKSRASSIKVKCQYPAVPALCIRYIGRSIIHSAIL